MRTTLDLDDDVYLAVRERARREGRTAGSLLSELARNALTAAGPTAQATGEMFGFSPLPHRGAAVSNDLIDALRDEDAR